MAQVVLDKLTKIYPNGAVGVAELGLDISDGEFLVLVGPSGCGKSTALRMVAGLEDITSGELRIGERVVNDVPPKDRDIAMVFQNYALYPHMTVGENIGFALKLAGRSKQEIQERVQFAARTLQLEEWLDRKPGQLSGGQRQRVAMGRAIVREPAVFLMDEPLSNLDAKLRVQMRSEIARLQRELKTTTIYVTHDQVEAMTMGDRVAVMRAGHLLQVAPPEDLYDNPDDLFVAAFIGSPAMNLIDVQLEAAGDGLEMAVGDDRIPVSAVTMQARPALASYAGRRVVLGVRPDALADGALGDPSPHRLRGEVELREALGSEVQAHVRIAARPAVTEDIKLAASDVDEGAVAAMERDVAAGSMLVVARFDPRSRVRAGDTVELAVDTERLHFFDPESGRAIRS